MGSVGLKQSVMWTHVTGGPGTKETDRTCFLCVYTFDGTSYSRLFVSSWVDIILSEPTNPPCLARQYNQVAGKRAKDRVYDEALIQSSSND